MELNTTHSHRLRQAQNIRCFPVTKINESAVGHSERQVIDPIPSLWGFQDRPIAFNDVSWDAVRFQLSIKQRAVIAFQDPGFRENFEHRLQAIYCRLKLITWTHQVRVVVVKRPREAVGFVTTDDHCGPFRPTPVFVLQGFQKGESVRVRIRVVHIRDGENQIVHRCFNGGLKRE